MSAGSAAELEMTSHIASIVWEIVRLRADRIKCFPVLSQYQLHLFLPPLLFMTFAPSGARAPLMLFTQTEGRSAATTNLPGTSIERTVVLRRSSRDAINGIITVETSERVQTGFQVSSAATRARLHNTTSPDTSSAMQTFVDRCDPHAVHLNRFSGSHAPTPVLSAFDSIFRDHHALPLFLFGSRSNITTSSTFRLAYQETRNMDKQLRGMFTSLKQTWMDGKVIPNSIRQLMTRTLFDIVHRHPFEHCQVELPWPNPESVEKLVRKSSRHCDYVALAKKFVASHPECPIRALGRVEQPQRRWRPGNPFAELVAKPLQELRPVTGFASHAFDVLRYCFVTQLASTLDRVCFTFDICSAEIDLFFNNWHPMIWMSFTATGAILIIQPNHRDFLARSAGEQSEYSQEGGSYHTSGLQAETSPLHRHAGDRDGRTDDRASSFSNAQHVVVQEGVFTNVQKTQDPTANPQSPLRNPPQPTMFSNAQYVLIQGGTFNSILNSYQNQLHSHLNPSNAVFAPTTHDMLLPGGLSSALPYAMLGLQVASFATRPYYSCAPLGLQAEPRAAHTTVYVVLRLPELSNDMAIMLAPFTIWLFTKMWVQRRATERIGL
ncbi:hypothetical protein D9619_002134 [Psilocybe cf. subviscida]|uniref:Uncharacterized protein n=1 Tax=Psilocybe cf. subviscida TaxID=2480587 RepID=A0A8H5BE75_9AGAR|nr:hypothetical protein D9619_002134 [Psilocybe cf. subviscida]